MSMDLPGMGGDFSKGVSGTGAVYDTSPAGLGVSPAYLAGGATASSSSSAGTALLAHGTKTSDVTTTAITFGTGVDVLASALSFTADGVSDYMLKVYAAGWTIATTSAGYARLSANVDGADAGLFAYWIPHTSGYYTTLAAGTPLSGLAVGAHTANARLWTDTGGGVTATITGGAGGVGATRPILVVVEKLA